MGGAELAFSEAGRRPGNCMSLEDEHGEYGTLAKDQYGKVDLIGNFRGVGPFGVQGNQRPQKHHELLQWIRKVAGRCPRNYTSLEDEEFGTLATDQYGKVVGNMFETIMRSRLTWTTEFALLERITTGTVVPHTNNEMFTTVLDMLSVHIISTLSSDASGSPGAGEEKRSHQALIKKLEKEVGNKHSDGINLVRQLLPVPRKTIGVITCEPMGSLIDTNGDKITGFDFIDKKQGLQVSAKQKINPWDTLEILKNPAPLSWVWFGGIRMERKPLRYQEQYCLITLYHSHNQVKPNSHYFSGLLHQVPPDEEDQPPPTSQEAEKPVQEMDTSQSEIKVGVVIPVEGSKEPTNKTTNKKRANRMRPAKTPAQPPMRETDISWRYILCATTYILLCGSLVPGASGLAIDFETHVLSYHLSCDDHLPLTPWIPTQGGILYDVMLNVFGMASGNYNYTADYVKAHSICNFHIGKKEDPCGGLYLSHKASKVRLVLNGSDYNCGHSLSFAIVQDAPTNHLRIFVDISIGVSHDNNGEQATNIPAVILSIVVIILIIIVVVLIICLVGKPKRDQDHPANDTVISLEEGNSSNKVEENKNEEEEHLAAG